ncbi:hypothetical protein DSO57_1035886 [Entomophthora muscae]|uniref:Uncharacterized protein n=1 Tax=Entomophthora muscae TaxID=34485 RepID=A0ACC2SCC0_9FUNG|nr:hypothetical protein DSO57_1035886 [Entomophthora muscae]
MRALLIALYMFLVAFASSDRQVYWRFELQNYDESRFAISREWKVRVPILFAAVYLFVAIHIVRKFSHSKPKKHVTFMLGEPTKPIKKTPTLMRSILKKRLNS